MVRLTFFISLFQRRSFGRFLSLTAICLFFISCLLGCGGTVPVSEWAVETTAAQSDSSMSESRDGDAASVEPTSVPEQESTGEEESAPVATVPISSLSDGALSQELEALQASLHQKIETWVVEASLARPNGYVYAIDIGQLLIHFATVGDKENYIVFRNLALTNLLVHDPSDSFTQGFIGWRYEPGQPLDASGTTEALWVARGFWEGSRQFNQPEDEAVALLILEGYAKHAFVDQEIWLIRNYFNFGTRAFASNSYLIDYYPDFLYEVAEAQNDQTLKELADNSSALFPQAFAPSGLLHSLILPEIKTLYPEFEVTVFSPNDIVQLSNACATAETVVKSNREVPQALLAFTENNLDNLRIYYYGRTGEAAQAQAANTSEWTCLTRLARMMNEQALTAQLLDRVYPKWQEFDNVPFEPKLFAAGQILLTIDELLMGD